MPKGNPGQSRKRIDCDNCGTSIDVGNFSRHRATCELRDVFCIECEKPFRAPTYKLNQQTCSPSCKMKKRNREEGLASKAGKKGAAVVIEKFRGTGTTPKVYVKENGKAQHRVVAERMLGRPLLPGEIVHHKDGSSRNNDESNIEVMTQSDHMKIHNEELQQARMESTTPEQRSASSRKGWETRRRNQ